MTAKNFKRSLSKVLVHEGGYSNHPADPGGATMKGVIQRVYDAYRDRKGLKRRSVKNITTAELEEIYRKQYWDACRCDDLPDGVDYVVFDGAVNSGPAQSIKWLQRALGVNADGVIGAITLQRVNSVQDKDALIDRVCDRRLAFLKALKTWPTFGKGWSSRVSGVRSVGKAWADPGKKEAPAVAFADLGDAKGYIESAPPPPTKAPADITAGAGLGAVGIGAGIETAKQTLSDYTDIEIVRHIVLGLVVAGLLVAGGGYAWRLYQKRKEAKRAEALITEGA